MRGGKYDNQGEVRGHNSKGNEERESRRSK